MMKGNLFLEVGWGELNHIGASVHGKKGAGKTLARRNGVKVRYIVE